MFKRTFAWLRDVIIALYIAPLKEAFIDVREFPLGLKILAWGGYAAVFLLLMTLLFEIFGARLPMVHFVAFETGHGDKRPLVMTPKMHSEEWSWRTTLQVTSAQSLR